MSTAASYTLDRTLTRVDRNDAYEADARPLDIRLIVRLLSYTGPYAVKRNWLLLCVLLRTIQLPALTWLIAAVIKGPIAGGDVRGMIIGAAVFLVVAISTQFVMHFRQRLALELGESVVFDLRNEIFAHLQTLPMSFFNRTKLGRIISRMSSDVEDVRMGIQEVLFVSLVSLGQMAVAAACMLWFDSTLFLMVLLLVPVLAGINHYFRRKMSIALRRLRESFSRVTATLAESVNGIRLTQGYVRQDTNGEMFGELVADHAAIQRRAQSSPRAVSAAVGFEQPILRRRAVARRRLQGVPARRTDRRRQFARVSVHGVDVLLADFDAGKPIQSGSDGDGRLGARVPAARHAARMERSADGNGTGSRFAAGSNSAICRSATIRNGRCCMA